MTNSSKNSNVVKALNYSKRKQFEMNINIYIYIYLPLKAISFVILARRFDLPFAAWRTVGTSALAKVAKVAVEGSSAATRWPLLGRAHKVKRRRN